MLKTHFRYLKGAVGLAIKSRQSEQILEAMSHKQVSGNRVYVLIKEIVSDARFYHVTDADDFWRLYSSSEIRAFIDSIDLEIWRDQERLTMRKEDFLNQWLSSHIMPMSECERQNKQRRAIRSLQSAGLGEGIEMYGGPATGVPIGVHDMTGSEEDEESGLGHPCAPHRANDNNATKTLPDEIQQLDELQRGAGRGAATPYTVQAEFLRRIDPELLRLARMIGRTGCDGTKLSASRFGHSASSDITGITVGDDLNSLLPSELAMLATKETYDIFLRNYTRKRLQIFSSASHATERNKDGRGPIIMCIDTSGSMTGEPERMAKTLAMAIAIIAQRDSRPLVVVNYSYQVSFFVLTDLRRQWGRFMSFLALSYSGGNDENMLFDFVFAQLPQSTRYKHVIKGFGGADLLLISDFVWMPVAADTADLITKAHDGGMRLFALEVGRQRFEDVSWEDMPKNGEWFLQASDHHFVFHKGELAQLK